MKIERLTAAIAQAEAAHEQFPNISVDALFLAAFITYREPGKSAPIPAALEAEFSADFATLKGESMTATEAFIRTMWRNPTAADGRRFGAYLRQQGYYPRKSNGKLLYDF
jgi:hypothetical protein